MAWYSDPASRTRRRRDPHPLRPATRRQARGQPALRRRRRLRGHEERLGLVRRSRRRERPTRSRARTGASCSPSTSPRPAPRRSRTSAPDSSSAPTSAMSATPADAAASPANGRHHRGSHRQEHGHRRLARRRHRPDRGLHDRSGGIGGLLGMHHEWARPTRPSAATNCSCATSRRAIKASSTASSASRDFVEDRQLDIFGAGRKQWPKPSPTPAKNSRSLPAGSRRSSALSSNGAEAPAETEPEPVTD